VNGVLVVNVTFAVLIVCEEDDGGYNKGYGKRSSNSWQYICRRDADSNKLASNAAGQPASISGSVD